MKSVSSVALAFFVGIALGFGLSKGVGYNHAIDAGDILAAIMSLLVVTVIDHAAGRLSDRHKFLVECVMEDIRPLLSAVREIERFFDEASRHPQTMIACREALAAFSRASLQADAIDVQLCALGMQAQKQKLEAVRLAIGSLKQNTTDGAFPVDSYRLPPAGLGLCRRSISSVQVAVTALVQSLVE